jgi:cellobiose PTS system EIIB component
MLKVLLTCLGGMSSSMVVAALIKEAAALGIEVESKAVGTTEVARTLKAEKWDGILVAPQVRHALKNLSVVAAEHNVPIVAIKPQAYSPIGSKMLIDHLREMKLIP